jgi:hypothetical protein
MNAASLAIPHRDACEFLQLLAFTYVQNNRPCKAAVLLAAADRVQDLDERALLMLAMAQQRCGDARLALATLDRVEAMGFPPNALLHALRARSLEALGQPVESQAAMRDYLAARNPPAATGRASAAAAKKGKGKACSR